MRPELQVISFLLGQGWSDGQIFGLFRRKSTKGKYTRTKKPEWGWSAYTAGLWKDASVGAEICFSNKIYSDCWNAASCKVQADLKMVARA